MPRNSGSSGGMHYTKSGNLDMRYSSSRAYVASVGSSSGQSSSYSSGGTGGGGLHYTKTGNLDMRYSSSRAAVASSSGFSNSGISSGYSSGGSDLHYTKTGNLDMRYSSSKAAVASGLSGSTSSSAQSTSDGLHYTKTGNLDMRYASSKAAISADTGSSRSNSSLNSSIGSSDLHYRKDGSLDMRYKSSQAASSLVADMQGLRLKSGSKANGIPSYVPLTKNGLPDMRTRAAKDWVAGQKGVFDDAGGLPSWLPKLKDGRIDFKKNVVKAFMNGTATDACIPGGFPAYDPNARQRYYERRCLNSEYKTQMLKSRYEEVEPVEIYTPESLQTLYRDQERDLKSRIRSALAGGDGDGRQGPSVTIAQVDYKDFERFFTDSMKLGAGGFGVVYKAEHNGKTVAVKKLLMDKLPKHGKSQFLNEVEIMARFKDHTNLVKLEGYALEPGCILVMEYVKLGNLSYLIHHCEDPAIESKISDGRIKKRLVCGIVNGMMQLHAAGIVHRDLKPANVLVTEDYTAKLADFGFSALRGRTASMSARQADEEEDNAVAGTAGYMAPELLDPDVKSSFSIDVYAFGIVMNEIIHEEEPYADRYAELHARGPYGATILAKGGKRPLLDTKRVPQNTANLIKMCWSQNPDERPTFGQIATMLASRSKEIQFPDYISLGLGGN